MAYAVGVRKFTNHGDQVRVADVELAEIADVGRDAVSAGEQVIDNEAADLATGAKHRDSHDLIQASVMTPIPNHLDGECRLAEH